MKLFILNILVIIISEVGGGLLLNGLLSQYYFDFYPIMAGYFVLLSCLTWGVLYIARKLSNIKTFNLYMGMKIVKIILSIIILVIYIKAVNEHNISFGITFMSLYLIYLSVETWSFSVYLKNKKTEGE